MKEDFIQVNKKADSDEYLIRVYFAAIDSEINICLKEDDFIRFLNESVRLINKTSNKFTLRVPDEIEQLFDEYGVNQIYKIKEKFRRIKKETVKPAAEVTIYIPDKFVSLSSAESITNSAGEFMEALGFQLQTEDEPVFGSFFKKLRFVFSKTIGSEDLEQLYNKGKKALELKYVDLPTAEQTEKLANAAEKLINSLAEVDEGVVRCGALLVLKRQVDGKPKIVIQQLSTELIILLNKNPKLLFNPNTIYELLTGDVKGALDTDEDASAVKIA